MSELQRKYKDALTKQIMKRMNRDLGMGDVVRKKPKKKVKSPRKLAKAYADECCRAYAHYRYDKEGCVTCGRHDKLQWAHLLTGGVEATRWDIYNFAVQCQPCNWSHEHRPEKYTLWFLKKYGSVAYGDLVFRHSHPAHYKADDLRKIGDHYKRLMEVT